MNAIEFGKFLANLRNEKKLTQEELAEKLFIDKRKISRWECGMSIPDFETIIKLCEILDVTPYEFSICKRIEKEKLSKKVINKFKSIKDFKKYKLKKKVLIILSIILGIFFILMAIYTFKYYGKVEIYTFKSLDENYVLNGIYVQTNKYVLYSINNIEYTENHTQAINYSDNCKYEIYDNDLRIIDFSDKRRNINIQNTDNSKFLYYGKSSISKYINNNLILKSTCLDKKQTQTHSIKFKFIKKYDNKLF